MTAPINSQQPLQVPNYSGVNIQIFNPAVNTPGSCTTAPATNTYNNIPAYPANYYTNNYSAPKQPVTNPVPVATTPATATATATAKTPEKKTEKRDVVELTDSYIKNLESYLNNQNTDIRVQGGNEVISRLKEDDSRKSDPALNALVNKMLQDPSQKVRVEGMSALQSGLANGNDETVQILKNMQQKQTSYGEDSLDASNLLLKMAGNSNKSQKEFEVKDKPKDSDSNVSVADAKKLNDIDKKLDEISKKSDKSSKNKGQ